MDGASDGVRISAIREIMTQKELALRFVMACQRLLKDRYFISDKIP